MPEVYDNWERLVEAILKREELRRVALCPSFSSCTSDDSSSPSLIDFHFLDLNSDNTLEPLPGVGKRGVAARVARVFTAPPILRTLFMKTKPEMQHPVFFIPNGLRREMQHPVFRIPNKLRRFLFHELIIATDYFNNKNLLDRGEFGDVYKGRLEDGTLVAVKRCLPESTQHRDRQFQTEVDIISIAMHRNLLHLHGFCATTEERILVHPLMVHGTVASWLGERSAMQPPLDWSTRKLISLGSARGLEFLHQCHPIVLHRDVKAANILLDVDFEAVVGNFGFSTTMDSNITHVITPVHGTVGHVPPEYISIAQVSDKTDVFGYGVMLLELVTGQRAFDLARSARGDDVVLLHWVQKLLKEKELKRLIDPDLEGNYIETEWERLLQLAIICTQRSPVERPKMREVVKMLQGDEGLVERWEKLQHDKMIRLRMNYVPINWTNRRGKDNL